VASRSASMYLRGRPAGHMNEICEGALFSGCTSQDFISSVLHCLQMLPWHPRNLSSQLTSSVSINMRNAQTYLGSLRYTKFFSCRRGGTPSVTMWRVGPPLCILEEDLLGT